MTDQEQQSTETKVSVPEDEKPSVENLEKTNENEANSTEQRPTRRSVISEDIRYSSEQNDREKRLEKYDNYQVSQTNACNIRFLADHRQKQSLFGRPEGISKHRPNDFFPKTVFQRKIQTYKH